MKGTTLFEPQHPSVRLDVARGISAIVVLIGHVGQILLWRILGPSSAFAFLSGMAARHAVIVFFLLSGHLITKSAISNIKRNGQFDIGDYVTSRVARIYPPLIGAIILSAIAWGIIHAAHLPGSSIPYGFSGDLYRVREYFNLSLNDIAHSLAMMNGLSDADGPLWSLYIEFQIYIVVMGIGALWQPSLLPKISAIAFGLLAAILLRNSPLFVLLWGMGAATAMVSISRKISIFLITTFAMALLLATVIFPASWGGAQMDEPVGQVIQIAAASIYSLVLFYAYPKLRYPNALISTANYSYSLYVMHWPLLMLALSLTQNWTGRSLPLALFVAALSIGIIIPITMLAAYFLERTDVFKQVLRSIFLRKAFAPPRIAGAMLFTLIAAIALKTYQHVKNCEPHFDSSYVYIPSTKTPRLARTILIPGMDGTAENFLSVPLFKRWANGLAALGSDVVVLNTPIPKTCWFRDHGASYRHAFLHALSDIKADADRKHGHQGRVLLAGVSYGGLHVLEAYSADPSKYIGWEAALPVTKLNALAELNDAGDVSQFDPFNSVKLLRGSPGYITWGGKDQRVNHVLIEWLFSDIESPQTLGKGYSWLGHETTNLTIENLLHDAKKRITTIDDLPEQQPAL